MVILLDLLRSWDTNPDLILANLNSLLTEINTAYFTKQTNLVNHKLYKFIACKTFVEDHLTEHPSISRIAKELGVKPNNLYNIVKQYSELSPKRIYYQPADAGGKATLVLCRQIFRQRTGL